MKRIVLFSIFVFILSGCTQTENGLVFGAPDYEKRDIEVTLIDFDILLKANELLNEESVWSKDSIRECKESVKLSLFCALEKASIEVTGSYIHRQPALQEVRFIIDDHYKSRWSAHRLAGFNSHPDTSFEDVKPVITMAIETVKGKLHITREIQPTRKSGATD